METNTQKLETDFIRNSNRDSDILNHKLEPCFAKTETGCDCLDEKNCNGCSFYKTKYKFNLDRERTLNRISALPKEKQEQLTEYIKTARNAEYLRLWRKQQREEKLCTI